jgi:iron complex outermembrane receptor protein
VAITSRPIVFLWLFAVGAINGTHAGSLIGRVTAAEDTAGLPGVMILIQGTVLGTITAASGEYRILNLSPGRKTLVFSLVGYQRVTRTIDIPGGTQEVALDIAMVQAPIQTDPIVVTASRREQSLQDVPASISLVDAASIQERNAVSLEDALRHIPGVNLTGTQVNIRGSSGYSLGAGSRVLILLDGIPFIAGDTGEILFESIPMDQVDRIEVVKGAHSALYGSNALGGVINIITKRVGEEGATTARAYAGIYNKPDYPQWNWSDRARSINGQSVSYVQKSGDLGVSLFASRQFDDGYRQNDFHRRYNVFLKMREEVTPSSSLALTFGLDDQFMGQFLYWRNADSALITPLRHESDNIKSTRYFLSGHYTHAISEQFLLSVKGVWSHNDWGFQQTGEQGRTESLSNGGRLEILSTFMPDDIQTATLGIDGSIDVIGGAMFGIRTIGGLAFYGQDEIRLDAALMLTAGARWDLQSVGLTSRAGQFTPKIGAVYHVDDRTAIRGSYGEGFRVPSLPEAFIQAGSTGLMAVPNPDLKPERSRAYELGVSRSLGAWGSIDGALFRTDIDNLIEPGLFVAGGALQVQWRNVTRARIQGCETTFSLNLFDGGVACAFGYTYVYPQDLSAGDILKYRPRHTLTAEARTVWGWFRAGIDFRYLSRVERIDDELVSAGVIPDGDIRVPIYVTDVRCGAEFPSGGNTYSAMLNVRNLFQHNYVELIGNVMAPRTYILTLQAKI